MGLLPTRTYFTRCRLNGSRYQGKWSKPTQFTTRAENFPIREEAKLIRAGPVSNEAYGSCLKITCHGDRIIAGVGTGIVGKAVISTRNNFGGWSVEKTLTETDLKKQDEYGVSVGISSSGDIAIVGAPSRSESASKCGAIYVYRRTGTTWTLEQKLVHPNPANNLKLGSKVALSGNGLRIAACYRGTTTTFGIVIFKYNGSAWVVEKIFNTPETLLLSATIEDIALNYDGTYLAVGNTSATYSNTMNAGAVYLYRYSNDVWGYKEKLGGSVTELGGCFGSSVCFDTTGHRLIVGAKAISSTWYSCGAAFVFSRQGETASDWVEEIALYPSTKTNNQYFGAAVSITGPGTFVSIGAYYDDTKASNAGAVYQFKIVNEEWTPYNKFLASDGKSNDQFGY